MGGAPNGTFSGLADLGYRTGLTRRDAKMWPFRDFRGIMLRQSHFNVVGTVLKMVRLPHRVVLQWPAKSFKNPSCIANRQTRTCGALRIHFRKQLLRVVSPEHQPGAPTLGCLRFGAACFSPYLKFRLRVYGSFPT